MSQTNLSSDQPSLHSRSFLNKTVWYALVTLLLMAVSSYGTYYWQHRKVTSLDGKITSLNDNLSSSKQKVDFLSQQQKGLNDQLALLSTKNSELAQSTPTTPTTPKVENKPQTGINPVIPALTLEVLSARKYPATSDPATQRSITVNVSLSNTSAQSMNFLISDFQLRDEFNNTSTNFGSFVGETMVDGNVVLDSRAVAPGETIKGAMVFNTFNPPAGLFTLTYKTQTYPVTLER